MTVQDRLESATRHQGLNVVERAIVEHSLERARQCLPDRHCKQRLCWRCARNREKHNRYQLRRLLEDVDPILLFFVTFRGPHPELRPGITELRRHWGLFRRRAVFRPVAGGYVCLEVDRASGSNWNPHLHGLVEVPGDHEATAIVNSWQRLGERHDATWETPLCLGSVVNYITKIRPESWGKHSDADLVSVASVHVATRMKSTFGTWRAS